MDANFRGKIPTLQVGQLISFPYTWVAIPEEKNRFRVSDKFVPCARAAGMKVTANGAFLSLERRTGEFLLEGKVVFIDSRRPVSTTELAQRYQEIIEEKAVPHIEALRLSDNEIVPLAGKEGVLLARPEESECYPSGCACWCLTLGLLEKNRIWNRNAIIIEIRIAYDSDVEDNDVLVMPSLVDAGNRYPLCLTRDTHLSSKRAQNSRPSM